MFSYANLAFLFFDLNSTNAHPHLQNVKSPESECTLFLETSKNGVHSDEGLLAFCKCGCVFVEFKSKKEERQIFRDTIL